MHSKSWRQLLRRNRGPRGGELRDLAIFSQWQKRVLNEDKALPLLKAAWDTGLNSGHFLDVYSNVSARQQTAPC